MAAKHSGQLPQAADDGFFTVECAAVTDESADVKTFEFVMTGEQRFAYAAGQHITVEAPATCGVLHRCYTLSSAPTRAGRIAITVKAATGGPVSTWLHREISPGARMRISAPSGAFVAPRAEEGAYLFVAGGVGITPLLSMTRALFDVRAHADIVFVQCARSREDLLFRDELEAMAAGWPGLRVHLVVSRDAAAPLLAGRLERDRLAQWVPDIAEREVYCCGPDTFMTTVEHAVAGLGVAPHRYHQESFVLPEANRFAGNPNESSGGQVTVKLAASNRSMTVSSSDLLIDIAQAAGVVIPNACRAGMCGTCKTRLISGKVEMAHNGGITDDEVTEGLVLACCARPLTDVSLDC